jgi:hypothetical protein
MRGYLYKIVISFPLGIVPEDMVVLALLLFYCLFVYFLH